MKSPIKLSQQGTSQPSPDDEARFNAAASSVLFDGLTIAMTGFAVYNGRGLLKAVTWPDLGWYRWVVPTAEIAFIVMLVWGWSRLISNWKRNRKHNDHS